MQSVFITNRERHLLLSRYHKRLGGKTPTSTVIEAFHKTIAALQSISKQLTTVETVDEIKKKKQKQWDILTELYHLSVRLGKADLRKKDFVSNPYLKHMQQLSRASRLFHSKLKELVIGFRPLQVEFTKLYEHTGENDDANLIEYVAISDKYKKLINELTDTYDSYETERDTRAESMIDYDSKWNIVVLFIDYMDAFRNLSLMARWFTDYVKSEGGGDELLDRNYLIALRYTEIKRWLDTLNSDVVYRVKKLWTSLHDAEIGNKKLRQFSDIELETNIESLNERRTEDDKESSNDVYERARYLIRLLDRYHERISVPQLIRTKDVKYILGPVSLSYHVDKFSDTQIYLFGDVHRYKTEAEACGTDKTRMRIDRFIQQTIKEHPDDTIDLFVEHEYGPVAREQTANYSSFDQGFLFGELRRVFKQCHTVKTRSKCRDDYPNLRLHTIDIRNWMEEATDVMEYGIEGLIKRDLPFAVNSDESPALRKDIERLREWKRRYYGKGITRDVKEVMVKFKVTKQIDGIFDKTVRKALLKWFDQRLISNAENMTSLNRVIKTADKLLKTKKQLKDTKNKKLIKELDKVYTQLKELLLIQLELLLSQYTTYMVIWQDVYNIARILRTYKDGTVIDNAIVYVGDLHARNIREFFNSSGMKKRFQKKQAVNLNRDDYVQCVPVGNKGQVQVPFFD